MNTKEEQWTRMNVRRRLGSGSIGPVPAAPVHPRRPWCCGLAVVRRRAARKIFLDRSTNFSAPRLFRALPRREIWVFHPSAAVSATKPLCLLRRLRGGGDAESDRVGTVVRKGRERDLSEIKLKKGEPIDRALRRLKKKVDRENTLREVRNKRHYEKPSERRRRKLKVARFSAMLAARYADQ